MARKSKTYTNEDSAALTHATNNGLQSYTDRSGPVRVTSLLMEYGGSKAAMARDIAGIGAGKLPAKGTPERLRYEAANKSVGRWLAYESGSGKQARNPGNKETQARLKTIKSKVVKPSGMSITISGYIGYDDDFRYRTITTTFPSNGVTAQQFLEHMRTGNTHEAYQDVFQAYKVGRGIVTVADDNPDVSIDFSDTSEGATDSYEEEE